MKKIFGILLFFAFNFFCDAQNINFFTSKIEKTLTGGLTFRHLSDFSMENAAAEICFSADMKELSFNSGFKLQRLFRYFFGNRFSYRFVFQIRHS